MIINIDCLNEIIIVLFGALNKFGYVTTNS